MAAKLFDLSQPSTTPIRQGNIPGPSAHPHASNLNGAKVNATSSNGYTSVPTASNNYTAGKDVGSGSPKKKASQMPSSIQSAQSSASGSTIIPIVPTGVNPSSAPMSLSVPSALNALTMTAAFEKRRDEESAMLLSRKRQRTEEDHATQQATRQRMQQLIAADQKAAMNADVETPFADAVDVVRRLLPFHVFHHPQEELEYAITAARTQALSKGKGKAKELDVPPHLREFAFQNGETEMAIQLHQEVRSLRERFRKLRIREGENTNPSEQVYWLTQATIDSERTLNTQLSHKLREEKLKKENAERDKRLSAIATTTAATQRQPVPPSYSYPVATGQPAFPNMAQYMNNPAYQTYYQQYAAAMATMTPADLQARAAIYAQTLRYPYAPAYPYGQYVAAPGVQFPPPNVFPPAFYSPETMSNPATAASTPPSSATPLTPAGQPQPYTPPNSAIPLTLPAAALETLKASGIVPVSSQNLPSAGQPQPAVVLLSMSPDNSVANVTINLSLLLPEQRGKLSGVLQSLVKGNAAVALSG